MTFRNKISNAVSILLVKPIERLCENAQWIRPCLVATCEYTQEWSDEDTGMEHEEEITFYLLEYPSGRRAWEVHEYGMCAETFTHQSYLKDVLSWIYGGPLPRGAKKTGATVLEVINIEPAQQPPAN